jgi:hypothetical protein
MKLNLFLLFVFLLYIYLSFVYIYEQHYLILIDYLNTDNIYIYIKQAISRNSGSEYTDNREYEIM